MKTLNIVVGTQEHVYCVPCEEKESLTHGVHVCEGGAVDVAEGVLQLGGARQLVEHGHDGGGDLVHSAAVGGGGVQDLVQQGADDGSVVALGVTDLGGCLAVGGGGQEAQAAQVGGGTQVLQHRGRSGVVALYHSSC